MRYINLRLTYLLTYLQLIQFEVMQRRLTTVGVHEGCYAISLFVYTD